MALNKDMEFILLRSAEPEEEEILAVLPPFGWRRQETDDGV